MMLYVGQMIINWTILMSFAKTVLMRVHPLKAGATSLRMRIILIMTAAKISTLMFHLSAAIVMLRHI